MEECHAYIIIWKPLFEECLKRFKEPINKAEKNANSLVHTNPHCKGEGVVDVQQKSSWLHQYFYPCPIALWTSLQLEKTRQP